MVAGPFKGRTPFHQHHAESRLLRSHADWRSKCPSRGLRSAADVQPRLVSRCERLASKLPGRYGSWRGLPVSGLLIRERREPQQQVQLLVSLLGTLTLAMLSMRHRVLLNTQIHTRRDSVRHDMYGLKSGAAERRGSIPVACSRGSNRETYSVSSRNVCTIGDISTAFVYGPNQETAKVKVLVGRM